MRIHLRLFVGILLAASAAHAQTAASHASPPGSEPKAAKPAMEVPADYKIGPQDVLRVDVWKEPEIARTVPVRPDGKISLPLLNDVQASGLTAVQLAGVIREGLTKFITSPQVTVTVSEINSRRVYCTGEITRQGAMPLLPSMTALQAISSCGGFTPFAKIKNIYILRTDEHGNQAQLPFNYKEVIRGRKPEENILLKPGDIIVVP